MPMLWAQAKLSSDVKLAYGVSLLIILLLAICIFSAVSRWLKVRMKLHDSAPLKSHPSPPTLDPWTESAKRLRVQDDDKKK